MDKNNLVEYCKKHSIRMACRICNRSSLCKEDMELVLPADGTFKNIRYCQLSAIVQENAEIFLCETCIGTVYRCAYGMYQLRHGFVLRVPGNFRCLVCKGNSGIKRLDIKETDEKYQVLSVIVEDFVVMPSWICKACDELLEDMFELHHTTSMTTLEIQEVLESERISQGKQRISSLPIDIPKPRIRLPIVGPVTKCERKGEIQNVVNPFLPQAFGSDDDISIRNICCFPRASTISVSNDEAKDHPDLIFDMELDNFDEKEFSTALMPTFENSHTRWSEAIEENNMWPKQNSNEDVDQLNEKDAQIMATWWATTEESQEEYQWWTDDSKQLTK